MASKKKKVPSKKSENSAVNAEIQQNVNEENKENPQTEAEIIKEIVEENFHSTEKQTEQLEELEELTTNQEKEVPLTGAKEKEENIMSEHKEKVAKLFKEIAHKYDLLNHVCSLGFDYWWRHVLVRGFIFGKTNKALDMAAGTLDVSIKTLRTYKNVNVVAGDICVDMLEYGKHKTRGNEIDRLVCEEQDATAITHENESFDVVSIAFGIRNVDEKEKALAQMHRVLVSGGQLHILEFSPVKNKYLQKAYYFYLDKVMPKIAELFGAKSEAYTYLGDSIKNFPEAEDFVKMIKNAGFELVTYKKLTFGIVTIYTAIKG